MNTSNQSTILSTLTDLAVTLIVVIGLIHLEMASDYFTHAVYESVLFVTSGIAALIAAAGIHHGLKKWGWRLGLLVAGGAMALYVVSHTVGLPGLAVDTAWFEPIGVLSLIVEGAYVVLAMKVLSQSQSSHHNGPRLTAAG